MRFVYRQCNIPSLSWLAAMNKNTDEVVVYHGDMVECRDEWFVSGVWDGGFNQGDFDKSHFACCSGAKLSQDEVFDASGGVLFITPQHVSEQLFSYIDNDKITFSNSLAFIIEFNSLCLDENNYRYEEVLGSVLYGKKGWNNKLPLKNGKTINIHRSSKIHLGLGLDYNEEYFSSNLKFDNYDDYISKVRTILKNLVINATDKSRKHQYGMISTISTGYDATATSALAYEQGCNDVITFSEPKQDRGDGIAKTFGYKSIYIKDSLEYLRNETYLEAEVCCTGNIGGANFSAFEEITSGKLIFMGFRGDTMWDKNNPNVNDDMNLSCHGYLYDTCLHDYEFCYRTNSVIIPLPMIGFDRWSNVHAISNSDEMKPWCVGGNYDRPIPRRVIEEKGVKRESFGKKKQGAGSSYHFNTYNSLKGKMSTKSFKKLDEFKQSLRKKRWRYFMYCLYYYYSEWPIYANYALNKLKIQLHFNERKTGKKSSPVSSLLFLWGISVVKQRYKIIK